MATRATFFMSLLGPQGFRDLGDACLRRCTYLRDRLSQVPGLKLVFEGLHFKEFVLRIDGDMAQFLEFMAKRNILAGVPLHRFNMDMDDCLLVAVTETRTQDELDRYVSTVREFLNGGAK